jgi:gliding-associated putative ABC transporter substrate-binding component GldG
MTPPRDHRRRADAPRATAAIAFTVAALVLLNLVATRVVGRLDLTEDKVYTLSPASRAMVRALPDYLTIKAYLSSDLPPELAALRRYARDLLAEYREAAGGHLRFEVYDPDGDEALEDQASRCGVAKVAVQVRRGDKAEVGRHYLGLCLHYNGRSRPLSQISQAAGLEYQITGLIKSLTQKKRKVAFSTGHGERDLGQDYSFVKRALQMELDVVTLNPSENPITDDVDLLVVAGPRRPLEDRALREIDAFLMKGNGALFLLDGMEPVPAGDAAAGGDRRAGRPIDTGLDPLLERYGFRVGRDLVFDAPGAAGPVGPDEQELYANLPAFVAARPDAAASSLPILTGVPALAFPFASSVALAGPLAAGAPRGQLWRLAQTSADAWRQLDVFSLGAPTPAPPRAARDAAAPFALAYAYLGILTSAYAAEGRQGMAAAARTESRRPVHLVVVGDSDFVSDRYMRALRALPVYAGGAEMLLNSVSWTLEEEALVSLRASVLRARPIDAGSLQATTVTWANAVGVPALFCAAGLVRWRWRRAARQRQTLLGRRPA